MISRASVFPVVFVVGDLVRMHVVLVAPQNFGKRIIERFQRAPRAVQEVVPPRVHLSSRWDARHTPNVVVIELSDALPLRQSF